jgi:hypothetical protein
MSSKLLKTNLLYSQLIDVEQARDEKDADIVSLDSISNTQGPVEDFRVLVSNLATIEESMTAKAKTVSQKKQLLSTWEKLKGLLYAMVDRLEKDIEKSRRVEEQIELAKQKAILQQGRVGFPTRFM